MPDKTIGIAFLGSGFAKNVQAPAFAALEGVKLIGASSPNNAAAFAAQFNMPVHTTDWKELIKREDVDLVVITSPPKLHCEQAVFALEQGKHVICEKPFAMNVAEAREMAQVASEKKQLAIIDHELRFAPGRRWLRQAIQNGVIGKVFFASGAFHNISRRDMNRPYGWWFDQAWGGGAWGAIGSHLIDQMQYLIGDIADLQVKLHTSIPERKDKAGQLQQVSADDAASAVFRFSHGPIGQLFSSFVSTHNSLDIEITGELGSIKIDKEDKVYFAEPGKPYQAMDIGLSAEQQALKKKHDASGIADVSVFSNAFIHFADAVIKTLQAGKYHLEGAATFEDGIKIQQLMDSHKSNR